NRAHNADQAEAAIETVGAVFDSFSIDLIFGLPEQPFEYWGANLEKGVRLGVPHFSTYSLTIEEKTPLANQVSRGVVEPATDETMRERFLFTMEYLVEHGYDHYEVCSFAKLGRRSLHNQAYWHHENYLGFGPSAHSFWRTTRSKARRWSNVRSIRQYNASLGTLVMPVDTDEQLGAESLADEYAFLGLRLMEDGLNLDRYERDYGVDLLTDKRKALAELEKNGLISVSHEAVRLTRKGAAVADAVALELVA
ncbi:MAG: coproporphyrinogen III oxidase family protein, partial [Rubricoccaceae bacterium]|nr:coproporphyrinogen III oxidase family protein [Rubricoccaceae bacterium]